MTFMDEAIRVEYDVATEYVLTIIMFLACLCIESNFIKKQFHLNVHKQVTGTVGMHMYNVLTQRILSES